MFTPKQVLDTLKRYSVLIIAGILLYSVITAPDLWNTLVIATVAVLQSIVLAELA